MEGRKIIHCDCDCFYAAVEVRDNPVLQGRPLAVGGSPIESPTSLPAMIKSHRIQDKVRAVGFDWDQREQVWDKVLEEFTELKDEINKMDADKMENEFGDLFFSLINAARLYKINPDNALERTNQKFLRRFNYLESQTIQQGRSLKDMSLDEMDKIWDEAKAMGM